MENKINVYLASGWFTKDQKEVYDVLESVLMSRPELNVYRPCVDGIKLASNEFHDPKQRERVFNDNISHIKTADLVVANLDGRENFQDTGTVYEVGYAMASKIPVIGFQMRGGNMMYHMKSLSTVIGMTTGVAELNKAIDEFIASYIGTQERLKFNDVKSKILLVAPDDKEENIKQAKKMASVMIEAFGDSFRWIDDTSKETIGEYDDSIFDDVTCMVAVIDDRHPVVSWAMGEAYCRGIPIISYTNYDYGINIMLMASILKHVKGMDEFTEVINKIKRNGIGSIEKSDMSNIRAF